MKKGIVISKKQILISILFLSLSLSASGSDEITLELPASSIALLEQLGVDQGESRLPGVRFAEGVSQITGVAISPLLGVSALDSWNYFNTPPEQRHLLPRICRPVFWGIGLGILGLILLKDTVGTVLPALVKKPLDLLELFEDKFSAVIAGSALVPFLVAQHANYAQPVLSSGSVASGTATIPILAGIDPIWILTPLALVGFAVVWIVSHTINVLIVLSPFGFLDALLKAGRLLLLSLIGALYLLSPLLAALLALIIIAVCAYLAPPAFRLSFYGSVLSSDYLRSIFWKSKTAPEKIRCFIAKRGNNRLKVRTLGRVTTSANGAVVFRSRQLFVGAWRSVKLPANGTLYVTNGFLFPTLQAVSHETGRTETLLHLLPRYRHAAKHVAGILGVEFRKTPSLRGFVATKTWLTELLKAGQGKAIETSSAVENQVSS